MPRVGYGRENRREFAKGFRAATLYGLAAAAFAVGARIMLGRSRLGLIAASLLCGAASLWTAVYLGLWYRLIDAVGGLDDDEQEG